MESDQNPNEQEELLAAGAHMGFSAGWEVPLWWTILILIIIIVIKDIIFIVIVIVIIIVIDNDDAGMRHLERSPTMFPLLKEPTGN